MRPLYSASDTRRVKDTENPEHYRDEWRRDYARLIHSASFRRLQGKTQVFPGHEGDFFRNRLTHSLEVAQIAKSIAIMLNSTNPVFLESTQKIAPDLVEFAGIAHDLGHPPFGHNGEEALDECMRDLGGFEGNAQTFRILARLEKKETNDSSGERKPYDAQAGDLRCGLNLSFRSLASILKYDNSIPVLKADRPEDKKDSPIKGYYQSEKEIVIKIKKHVLGENYNEAFKTIECSIMDIADDIAYSTYDMEDVFKSEFYHPLDLFALPESIYDSVVKTINERTRKQYADVDKTIDVKDLQEILSDIFHEIFAVGTDDLPFFDGNGISLSRKKIYFATESQRRSSSYANNGYFRTSFTSNLVRLFISGVEIVKHDVYPQLHKARLDWETFVFVETLKNITYEAVIRSPSLQVVEYRGKDIIKQIFRAVEQSKGTLMPPDFREIYRYGDELHRKRTICDFIAGMTDRYAVEFYGRLFGANGMTMHKPL